MRIFVKNCKLDFEGVGVSLGEIARTYVPLGGGPLQCAWDLSPGYESGPPPLSFVEKRPRG
jgi:hypothetical protein